MDLGVPYLQTNPYRQTHTGGKEELVSRSSGTFLESYYLFSHTDSLPVCVI